MISDNNKKKLEENAKLLAAQGKGLLAIDESIPTIGKRFDLIGVENNEQNRKAYRGMLFDAKNLGDYISGTILFEETLYQEHKNGGTILAKIKEQGIIPGIKVDKGLSPLAGGLEGETWCKGIEGLDERLEKYYEQGARFAKWRAVLQISKNNHPSDLAIQENAWGLARYARTCQKNAIVPIIEPEILMDGDHEIEHTAKVQEKVLKAVYKACEANNVFLAGTLLKPSMTTPGINNQNKPNIEKVAEMTVKVMQNCVPHSVAGIMFLSGGLTEEDASIYLDAINKIKRQAPWSMSFSYGRALQYSCLKAWKEHGDKEAQEKLLARARANSKAAVGKYIAGSEYSIQKSLFESNYKY